MNSFTTALLLVALVGQTLAFAPQRPSTTASLTQLYGLFDFLQPQPPKPKNDGGMDKNVFGGKAARITIREDEDAA